MGYQRGQNQKPIIRNGVSIDSHDIFTTIVGTSATLIDSSDPLRHFIYITNISDTVIYIAPNGGVVLEQGIPLFPQGVFWQESPHIIIESLYAVSSVAGKKLSVYIGTDQI